MEANFPVNTFVCTEQRGTIYSTKAHDDYLYQQQKYVGHHLYEYPLGKIMNLTQQNHVGWLRYHPN